MGSSKRTFGVKKRIFKQAMNGVDMVKVGLGMYLLPECKANFGKEYASPLTSAIVNTVFSEVPSTDVGRRFIQDEENRSNVALVIERSIKPEVKLRQIITDAVRVKCTLSHAMNPNLSEPDFLRLCRDPIDNLKRLGLLAAVNEMPNLTLFLQNAEGFLAACKADLDYHRAKQS